MSGPTYRVSLVRGHSPAILGTFSGTFAEVVEQLAKSDWCPGTFRDSYRDAEHWIGADLLPFDIDEGLTLADAEARLDARGLAYAILPSRNHQKEKKTDKTVKPACDRFRVVFPLQERITDPEVYEATWKHHAAELLREGDPKVKNPGRFFYVGGEAVAGNDEGTALQVVHPSPAPVRAASISRPEAEGRLQKWTLPERIARATTYARAVVNKGGVAREGQGGDNQTLYIARAVGWDFGLDEATCFSLLKREWNDFCDPPWSDQGLTEKIRNAYKYEPDRVFGCKLLETDEFLPSSAALAVTDGPHVGDLEGSARKMPVRDALVSARVLRKDDEGKHRVGQIDDLVREWLRVNGYVYSYRRDAFLKPSGVQCPDVVAQVFQDLFDIGAPYPRELVAGAFDRATTAEEQRALTATRGRLACDPLGNGMLARFVRSVTGGENPLDVAVVAHFVWQVKRKLLGVKVDHHLMPILSGKRGSGKSFAVRQLLSVIEELFAEPAGLDALTDPQQALTFSRFPVLMIDELAGGTKADRDTLKGFITRPTVEARRLYSNGQNITKPNRSTLIGTCERRVADVLGDEMGMRRFYEIRCLDKLDWNEVNAIDYLALWREVDENGLAPVAALLDHLYRVQDTELRVDAFAEWVEEHLELAGTPVSPAALYSGTDSSYVERYRLQGYKSRHLTERQFRERLKTWANDPARPWHGNGGLLPYRKDSLGNMRVWFRLKREPLGVAPASVEVTP
jgi:hypothetical protein